MPLPPMETGIKLITGPPWKKRQIPLAFCQEAKGDSDTIDSPPSEHALPQESNTHDKLGNIPSISYHQIAHLDLNLSNLIFCIPIMKKLVAHDTLPAQQNCPSGWRLDCWQSWIGSGQTSNGQEPCLPIAKQPPTKLRLTKLPSSCHYDFSDSGATIMDETLDIKIVTYTYTICIFKDSYSIQSIINTISFWSVYTIV